MRRIFISLSKAAMLGMVVAVLAATVDAGAASACTGSGSGPKLLVTAPKTGTIETAITPINGVLSGGSSPTGSITFYVYQSSTAPTTCTTSWTQVGSPATTVTGDGTYNPSPSFIPSVAGTYWWYATYSGDKKNASTTSDCSKWMAQTVVTGPSAPSTLPSTTAVADTGPTALGGSITFTATVSGSGVTPTGSVTWAITGTGTPCSTTPVTLSGTATATCAVTGVAVGGYKATAVYGGDSTYTGSQGVDKLTIYSLTGPIVYLPGSTVSVPGPTVYVPGPTVTIPALGGPPTKVGKVEVEAFLFAVGPWTLFSQKTVHLKIHLWGRRGTVTGTAKLVFRSKTLCTLKLADGRGRCTVSSAKFGKGRHKLYIDYPGSSKYQTLRHLVNIYVHH